MIEQTYLQWLAQNTNTRWWNDSANTGELMMAIEHGASGVTTNPLLTLSALKTSKNAWIAEAKQVPARFPRSSERAEEYVHLVASRTAELFADVFHRSGAEDGYVCAQVDPGIASNREAMLSMAKRFASWAPNIAVKLPANEAGLDILELCISEGITVTATVSFTVAQIVAIAERYRRGIDRANRNEKQPGRCFAVIMIGRIDDYLKDMAKDNKTALTETQLNWAGLAITKRAYRIYREKGYKAKLCVAALRGSYHLTELAGADLVMSIHPKYQKPLFSDELPCEKLIDKPVPQNIIEQLLQLPEFVRAYEPDGLQPREFFGFGVFQRTLTQFRESGWRLLEQHDFNHSARFVK